MLEVRRHLDLGQEPFDAQHRAELRVEHLESDPPVVLAVARQVDGRHATAANLALDLVSIRQCAGDCVPFDHVTSGRLLGAKSLTLRHQHTVTVAEGTDRDGTLEAPELTLSGFGGK